MEKVRCSWCNLKNNKYVIYHDNEWSNLNDTSDRYLFEMLVLEGFQAGLSFECILNKRQEFSLAFADFDYNIVMNFDENKVNELINNEGIVRNKLKIKAAINNAKIFALIVKEHGGFYNYLITFCGNKIIYENDKTSSSLSDKISFDLKKRGMKFVGSVIIYSYLQAIGIINSHENTCFLFKKERVG